MGLFGGILFKLFILYSLIPLNRWYMNTLWGVGGGLFNAAQDTKRSVDQAAQKAVNSGVAGATAYMGYKDNYNNALKNDKITGTPMDPNGANRASRATAITAGGAGLGSEGMQSKSDIVGKLGRKEGKSGGPSTLGAVGAAAEAAALTGVLGVSPMLSSRIAAKGGAKAYDKQVGTTAEQRAELERQRYVNQQNAAYEEKGYNADPQAAWMKKNADGTVEYSRENHDGEEGWTRGTYVPLNPDAQISSDESRESLKNTLDKGLYQGNHYVGQNELPGTVGDGVFVEQGAGLVDANDIVNRNNQYQATSEIRQAEKITDNGLDASSATSVMGASGDETRWNVTNDKASAADVPAVNAYMQQHGVNGHVEAAENGGMYYYAPDGSVPANFGQVYQKAMEEKTSFANKGLDYASGRFETDENGNSMMRYSMTGPVNDGDVNALSTYMRNNGINGEVLRNENGGLDYRIPEGSKVENMGSVYQNAISEKQRYTDKGLDYGTQRYDSGTGEVSYKVIGGDADKANDINAFMQSRSMQGHVTPREDGGLDYHSDANVAIPNMNGIMQKVSAPAPERAPRTNVTSEANSTPAPTAAPSPVSVARETITPEIHKVSEPTATVENPMPASGPASRDTVTPEIHSGPAVATSAPVSTPRETVAPEIRSTSETAHTVVTPEQVNMPRDTVTPEVHNEPAVAISAPVSAPRETVAPEIRTTSEAAHTVVTPEQVNMPRDTVTPEVQSEPAVATSAPVSAPRDAATPRTDIAPAPVMRQFDERTGIINGSERPYSEGRTVVDVSPSVISGKNDDLRAFQEMLRMDGRNDVQVIRNDNGEMSVIKGTDSDLNIRETAERARNFSNTVHQKGYDEYVTPKDAPHYYSLQKQYTEGENLEMIKSAVDKMDGIRMIQLENGNVSLAVDQGKEAPSIPKLIKRMKRRKNK